MEKKYRHFALNIFRYISLNENEIMSIWTSQHAEILGVIRNMKSSFHLTRWDWEKLASVFQTTFWNWFSSMKMFLFCLKFHWSLLLRAQLTIFQLWSRQWLGAFQATSHYLKQWCLVYSSIYVLIGLSELIVWRRIWSNIFLKTTVDICTNKYMRLQP